MNLPNQGQANTFKIDFNLCNVIEGGEVGLKGCSMW